MGRQNTVFRLRPAPRAQIGSLEAALGVRRPTFVSTAVSSLSEAYGFFSIRLVRKSIKWRSLLGCISPFVVVAQKDKYREVSQCFTNAFASRGRSNRLLGGFLRKKAQSRVFAGWSPKLPNFPKKS